MINQKEIDEFIKQNPSFSKTTSSNTNKILLEGRISIYDANVGFLWDSFKVRYEIRLDNPFSLPEVFVLDHKEIHNVDRHIKTDGCCCFAPEVEIKLILGKVYNLNEFTEKIVKPFFAMQIYKEKKGEWSCGEYAHYEEGLFDYYKEKFNLSSNSLVLEALKILSGKNKIGRNDKCFCGSGQKFKKCHLKQFDDMRYKVERCFFENDFENLMKKNKDELQ